MFGKKKLLKEIQKLQERVTYLENMHVRRFDPNGWDCPISYPFTESAMVDAQGKICVYRGFQVKPAEAPAHPQPKQVDYKRITNVPATTVNTNRIPKVTLEELARLVIDHTPIVREEKVESKRISNYTEDTTMVITIPE